MWVSEEERDEIISKETVEERHKGKMAVICRGVGDGVGTLVRLELRDQRGRVRLWDMMGTCVNSSYFMGIAGH